MASPFKFLRRLVSPRGERKQGADKVDGAKPNVLALPGPTDRALEEGIGDAVPPASLEPPYQDPSDTVAAKTAPADDTEAETGTAEGVHFSSAAVGGSASADEADTAVTAAHALFEIIIRDQSASTAAALPANYSRIGTAV